MYYEGMGYRLKIRLDDLMDVFFLLANRTFGFFTLEDYRRSSALMTKYHLLASIRFFNTALVHTAFSCPRL